MPPVATPPMFQRTTTETRMTPPAVFAIALSMSVDSFAASLGKGAAAGRLPLIGLVRIAALFALCETASFSAGWLAGHAFSPLIASVDHWIAFGLLFAVGVHMIRHGAGPRAAPRAAPRPALSALPPRVFATAIATSIDAAAIGVSLAFIEVDFLLAVAIIALVTFAVALGGATIGRSTAAMLGRRAEIVGGLAMICIGAAIPVQHLYF